MDSSLQRSDGMAARRFWGAPRPPQASESRPRVRALIEDALEVVHGVLVVGPPGSGRTTALADWAAHTTREGLGVWFQIEPEYGSRCTFWTRFLEVLTRAGALTEQASKTLTALVADSSQLVSLPVVLAHQLEAVGQPVTVVLDQGEYVTDMQLALDLFQLLQHAANVSIVTAAANLSGQAQTVMQPHRVRVIDAEQLALNQDECAAVFVEALGPAGSALAAPILSATGGWPELVRAVANALIGLPPSQWQDRIRTRLLSFLTERVAAAGLSGDTLQFIALASLAEYVTPELAAKLSGTNVAQSERILHGLLLHGFGAWNEQVSPVRQVFCFTPILAPFLVTQRAGLTVHQCTQAHVTIAKWMRDHGDAALAFLHLLRAEHLDEAEDTLISCFPKVMTLSPADAIAALEAVSPHVIADHPIIQFARGVLRNGSPDTAIRAKEDLAAAAVTAARQWYTARGLRRAVLGIVIVVVARLTGRWSAIEEVLPEVEGVLESLDNSEQDSTRELRLVLLSQVAVTLLRAGYFTRSAALARRILSYPDAGYRVPDVVAQLRGIVAFQFAVVGDMVAARSALNAIPGSEVLPPLWGESYHGVHTNLARAIVALEAGQPDQVEENLRAVERHYPTLEFWPEALVTRAWHLVSIGSGEAALSLMRRRGTQLDHHTPCSPLIRQRLTIEMTFMAAMSGNREYSDKRIRELPKSRPLVLLTHALTDLYAGSPERGLTLAAQLAPEPLPPRHRLMELAIVAGAQWLAGEREDALRTYQRAAGMAAVEGMTSPLRMLPRDITDALHAEFVRRADPLLVERAGNMVQLWGSGLGVPVEHAALLTSRERQVLELLADGNSAARIAQILGTSVNTVKTQRRNLYRKLGAGSREQALAHGRQLGILGR